MGEIIIRLQGDLEASIENLVSQGIYKEKQEAIVALVRLGLSALKKREEPRVHVIPGPHIPPFKPPEKLPDHYEFKK